MPLPRPARLAIAQAQAKFGANWKRSEHPARTLKVNTSTTDYYAVQQLQLVRFDGKRWVRFGDLVYDQ